MRWVQATILSIALISAALGGYSTTALLAVEARHDTALNKLSSQLSSLLQSTPMKAIVPSKSLPSTHSKLSTERDVISSLRTEIDLLRGELLVTIDEGDGETGLAEPDYDKERAAFEVQTPQIEQNFESEMVDADWGSQAELDIQAGIENGAPEGTHVTSTECRSTICRIEVDFDDALTRLEGMQSLALQIPWSGESMLQNDDATDGNSVVLYVAREGETLYGGLD